MQVGDARSQVVRETCTAISTLVSNRDLKPKVASAAKQVYPALFKLTYVTIKIISESAMKCLDSLVLSLPPGLTIHQLEGSSQDTHAQARGKSAGCLALLLSNITKAEELQGLLPAVEDLILRGLDDVSPDARSASKTCFARLQLLCPDRAVAMAARIKEPVRKQLALDGQATSLGKAPDAEPAKSAFPRLTQRTDFRAARLQFRSKNAGQAAETASVQHTSECDSVATKLHPASDAAAPTDDGQLVDKENFEEQ